MGVDLAARSAFWLVFSREVRWALLAPRLLGLRAALVACLLAGVAVAHAWTVVRAAPGYALLRWLADINFWVVVLCGVGLFPALLRQEHEQGTQDLLRLAGCRPTTLLLARAAGVGAGVFTALVVQVPFLLLSVTLGGVGLADVIVVVALLCGHTVAIYGVALLVTSRAPSPEVAARRVWVAVACVSFAPEWLGDLLEWLTGVPVIGGCGFGTLATVLRSLANQLPMHLVQQIGATADPIRASTTVAGAMVVGIGALLFTAHELRQPAAAPRAATWRPGKDDAVASLSARELALGRVLLVVIGCVFAAAALCLLQVGARGGASAILSLFWLESFAAMLLAASVAARATGLHVSSGVVPLLTLAGGDRSWLRQVRRGRRALLVTLGVLLFGTAAPFVATVSGSAEVMFVWAHCASAVAMVLLADAIGERCGLTIAQWPAGVAVIVVFVAHRLSALYDSALRSDSWVSTLSLSLILLTIAVLLWRGNLRSAWRTAASSEPMAHE